MKLPRFYFSFFGLLVFVALISIGLGVWHWYVAWPAAWAEFYELNQQEPTPELTERYLALVKRYPALAKEPETMHWGAKSGNAKLCRRLWESGAPLNEVSVTDKETPFSIALENDYADVVEFLIEQGVNESMWLRLKYSFMERQPLHIAAEHGNLKICQILVEAGADVNVPRQLDTGKNDPLTLAIRSGNANLVAYLLDQGADHYFPKKVAIRDIAQQIMKRGDPNSITPENADRIIQLLEERYPRY